MIRILLFVLLSSLLPPLHGQPSAEYDVYLFSLQKSVKGDLNLFGAKYLTAFNRGGYSNQPWFTPSGDLLLSVRLKGETQNDIWQLSIDSKKYRKLTQTFGNEYSPRIHPDEEHLSFLLKIGNEPLDQQVYKVNMHSGELESVTPEMKNIGYYTWLNQDTDLGLYRIDEGGNNLSYYDASEHKTRRITTSIGRTLMSDKEGHLIYIHKFTEDFWYIKKYDPATSTIEIVTQAVGKNEDFTIGPDGTFYMGNNHLLYYFHPLRDKEWKQLSDLSAYGIKYISRLAVSPDGKEIAVVASKEKS